jgi:hypothetical protein
MLILISVLLGIIMAGLAISIIAGLERVHPRDDGREHDGAAWGAWAGPISFDAENGKLCRLCASTNAQPE